MYDVNNDLIGKIVLFNNIKSEIIYAPIHKDKAILRSVEKYVIIEGFEPVHKFYIANINELIYL